jgi:hypothetical protein
MTQLVYNLFLAQILFCRRLFWHTISTIVLAVSFAGCIVVLVLVFRWDSLSPPYEKYGKPHQRQQGVSVQLVRNKCAESQLERYAP